MESIEIKLIGYHDVFIYHPATNDRASFKREVLKCLDDAEPLNFYCTHMEKEIIIPYESLEELVIEI